MTDHAISSKVVVDLIKCRICELKCTKLRLVAALRPDPLGELERSPDRLALTEASWAKPALAPNFFTVEPGLSSASTQFNATEFDAIRLTCISRAVNSRNN